MAGREGLARLVLAAAIVAGVSYLAAEHLAIGSAANTIWKGAGVGLLAIYAALQARSLDGWLIAAVMALGAAGDVLLETAGMTTGALAFLAGHLTAIVLYLRNRRPAVSFSQALLSGVLIPAVAAAAVMLAAGQPAPHLIAVYALGLGAMAASAWISRFPRYWTGLGAMAFVASDLFLFARMGPLQDAVWIGFAVWSLYFAGQAMIVIGVTRRLAEDTV